MMLSISIILMCAAILIISVNVSKLEKRIEQIETFLCRDEEWLENEVDDQ